ncbi:unnamed protein product [Anisakis simplex]|uniref:Uncharacterized protein n=1 Tax=Anisakis simplex TaxID=6269 RepID=A0A0M3KBQ2_ANISI|nr:unnamed protein product [Anisakis simplex]
MEERRFLCEISTNFRQYDDDWFFGLEDDALKCSSSPPPPNAAAADMALTVPMRTSPSPSTQMTNIPMNEAKPPFMQTQVVPPAPKLSSPLSSSGTAASSSQSQSQSQSQCEPQFITLRNHIPPSSVDPIMPSQVHQQDLLATTSNYTAANPNNPNNASVPNNELGIIDYELCNSSELTTMLPVQSTSPVIITKQQQQIDIQMQQPSTSAIQHNG